MLALIATLAFAQEEEETVEPVVADLSQAPWWTLEDEARAAFLETWEVQLPEQEPIPEDWEPSRFEVLAVPGVPIDVVIPRLPEGHISPWTWVENDASMDVRLGMVEHHRFTQVWFSATEWQPDVAAIQLDPEGLFLGSLDQDDDEMDFRFGETRLIEHDELGEVLVFNFQARDNFLERDLFGHALFFAIEGHGVWVGAVSSVDLTVAEMVTEDVLSYLKLHEPALPKEELRYGSVHADAGYSVELPTGWRALTDKEAQRLDRTRLAGEGPFNSKLAKLYIIDVERDEAVAQCQATTGDALEVIEPGKSPRAVENFQTYAKVALRGGKVRVVTGTEETVTQVVTEMPIELKSSEDIRWVSLGDREAYMWSVEGVAFDDPFSASVFYTTYADVGLACTAWADPSEKARLQTFEGVVEKLVVDEGEKHPMAMTLKGRYTRWWFSANPLLQLYWFPVPLFLIAGWLVVRED
jgi:hypothetical protein